MRLFVFLLRHVVRLDEEARYVGLESGQGQSEMYILRYAILPRPPLDSLHMASPLHKDVVEFTRLGEVLLAEDFNARTASCQVSFFDKLR